MDILGLEYDKPWCLEMQYDRLNASFDTQPVEQLVGLARCSRKRREPHQSQSTQQQLAMSVVSRSDFRADPRVRTACDASRPQRLQKLFRRGPVFLRACSDVTHLLCLARLRVAELLLVVWSGLCRRRFQRNTHILRSLSRSHRRGRSIIRLSSPGL